MGKPRSLVSLAMPVGAVVFALGALAGCGSKSPSGPEGGTNFSFDSGAGDTRASGGHDAGADAKPTGGKDSSVPTNRACGAPSGQLDWCATNSPAGSYVLCDDFDSDGLSSELNWVGVTVASLVNTHYSSPFCALHATVEGDGGSGVYTEFPNTRSPGSGGATLAFALFVAGDSACNGAVIGRVLGSAITASTEADAIASWLTLSAITGAGTSATSYTLGLSVGVGAGATPSAPVTLSIAPKASDDGWVRVALSLKSFSLLANPATLSATASWYYRDGKTAVATSKVASGSGQLMTTADNGVFVFDVGLIPDPSTKAIPSGCGVFIDDVVTYFSP